MAITGARALKNVITSETWTLDITGFNAFLIHKVKVPIREYEIIERKGGAQTVPVQQMGAPKAYKWSFEAYMAADDATRDFLYNWSETNKTRDHSKIYKDCTVTLIGPNDAPQRYWQIQDAAMPKMDTEEFESSADNKKYVNIKCEMTCNDCVEVSA